MKKRSNENNPDSEFFKQFKDKKSLMGFMNNLFKRGVEAMLEAEMEEHLGYAPYSYKGHNSGNSRNGKTTRHVKTSHGEMQLTAPRDRRSTFEPVILPKGKRMIDEIEDAVTGLYARGMSTSDISEQVHEIYGIEISSGTVSNITNRLLDDIHAWQNRPLEASYPVVWLDGIRFKVRHQGKIINKVIYIVIGLNTEGKKEALGLWIDETESAAFWMGVFTDLKARGVEDILILVSDNLSGLTGGLNSIFPKAITQVCIVHHLRNCLRYVVWKDKREFAADMKSIYNAPNEKAAHRELEHFTQKWSKKYPHACKSWKANWAELTPYLGFPLEIRKIIYTSNVIESVNSTIRKYTKIKTVFPTDMAAVKAAYMALDNLQKKWTQSIKNWPIIAQQLSELYPDRCILN